MDLFSTLKVNLKNLLFNSLITEASRFFIYQVVCCNSDGDFEEYFET